MSQAIYVRMERNVAVLRERLARPLTLSEKILLGHLDDPRSQELAPGASYLRVRADRVVFQDILGQTGLLQFMQTGLDRARVPATIHCDHLIQARAGGAPDLAASGAENDEIYRFLRSAAARYGLGFWEPGAGIIHQVVLERYAFPGELIVGTDSHTPNAGGLGACAIGIGGADAVEVLAGLPLEILAPRKIAVYLTGRLDGWTAPKDVILYVAGRLTVSGGTNAVVEYIGPGARTISATGKATICNMGAELGATTSLFPYDERMDAYLRATERSELIEPAQRYAHLLRPDAEVEAKPYDFYDTVIELDLSALEPHVVGPHTPDRARPLSALAAEVSDESNGFIDDISAALIGSCTNSSYEDMSRAADVAAQAAEKGARAQTVLLVTPGSEQVRATIERDGQLERLQAAGATVLANACGPCIGQWRRDAGAERPNTIVTSYNRNFPGRNDAHATTMNFIASPEIVTALALAGRLSFDPRRDTLVDSRGAAFRLQTPALAPEVPVSFARGRDFYVAPPSDGRSVELAIDPASERLAPLRPWPSWSGDDVKSAAILLKAAGKTTTDHITPAGKWMRFRGHLDKSSDNLWLGAFNAFTNEAGTAFAPDGAKVTPAAAARQYQAAGMPWVVVGDFNYGEGSSREHAALSPRWLGCVAVVARSFARIHETNLKKQGILALTFANPEAYERILRSDRISLLGLGEMRSGSPVRAQLDHEDGSTETIALRHSYSESQLEWFRAGSALNAMRLRPGPQPAEQ